MNEQNQASKPEENAVQKQQQADKPAAAEELKEEQLDEVAGGGHVKVFDGHTGTEIRGV
ncbi:MAG: hypothetical protein AB7K24_17895 [Gemmataceae bacterium]